jgi:uncharacterized integral membrane protein
MSMKASLEDDWTIFVLPALILALVLVLIMMNQD